MYSDPRIYPYLPEYTHLFNKCICATLPESTPPSQNIPPPFFNNYMQPSQNLLLPPRIYPPFLTTIILCDPPRIYPSLSKFTPLFNKFIFATLPEYTPPSQNTPPFNNYMRPSQILPPPPPPQNIPPLVNNYNIMRPPRIYPSSQNIPPFSTTIILCDRPRIYPSLPERPPFQQLYATIPKSTPPSESTPLFLYNYMPLPLPLRIYPSAPFYNIPRIYPSESGQNLIVLEKGGRFWEAGVDSGRVAHINGLKRGVYSQILGGSHNIIVVEKGVYSGREG